MECESLIRPGGELPCQWAAHCLKLAPKGNHQDCSNNCQWNQPPIPCIVPSIRGYIFPLHNAKVWWRLDQNCYFCGLQPMPYPHKLGSKYSLLGLFQKMANNTPKLQYVHSPSSFFHPAFCITSICICKPLPSSSSSEDASSIELTTSSVPGARDGGHTLSEHGTTCSGSGSGRTPPIWPVKNPGILFWKSHFPCHIEKFPSFHKYCINKYSQ